MNQISIYPGYTKNRQPERFSPIHLFPGELCAIVGNTGSGKSRLIKDIEQLADGDSVTGRHIFLDGKPVPYKKRLELSDHLVAHLSQNMRFVLDLTVEAFLAMHCRCRRRENPNLEQIVQTANRITPEPIRLSDGLNTLSGGQSRALMIADIALVCDSPLVLIDEIENAGIDKKKALQLLADRRKLVFIVTHEPHTALMASRRLCMENGAIVKILSRTQDEEDLYTRLDTIYEQQTMLLHRLRKGEHLI